MASTNAAPTDPRFPDFLILGAPKCGTTTLFDWLAAHPDTHMPVKEPGFLSQDVYDTSHLPRRCYDWTSYLGLICPPEAAAEGKRTGEATPRYLHSDDALRTIAERGPDAKLIVLLRNPVDLIYSLHGQYVKEGAERESDFDRAWRAAAEGRAPGGVGGRADRRFEYLFWGRLGARIEHLFSVLPRERVRVLLLEEAMSTDPAAAFAEILSFLDLAPFEPPTYRPSNERAGFRSLAAHRAMMRARAVTMAALAPIRRGPARGTGLMTLLNRVNRRAGRAAPRLAPERRAEIAALLAEDVARLRRALGRTDLPWPDFEERRSTTPSERLV